MLLPDDHDNHDPTSTIGSTDANATRTNPTYRTSSENSEPLDKEQWPRQQPERQEQRYPHEHHHHL
jgi:hypothetical protein